MRVMISVVLIAFAISGCIYEEQIGTTRQGSTDAGPLIGGSCEGFQMPRSDCTEGKLSCTFQSDCAGGYICNGRTGRCLFLQDSCVGTPCLFPTDCAGGEACNITTKTCFAPASSQACMPCFNDTDSGIDQCDEVAGGVCE